MTFLSRRTKEAIKTALAMTIAYAIALHMGWVNPYWAGFAVSMISLATAGQSLNKGVLRMLGALAAATCALTFLSWAFQDRWLMLIILTVFIGFCTYMLTGKKAPYFWFSCAYVCLIISIDNGGNSAHAFSMAMARVVQTAMGILVYVLVSVFLWPLNNKSNLENAAAKLVSTQLALFQSCRSLLTGQEENTNTNSLLTQEAQLLTQFEQILQAATTDTYEVKEVGSQWQNFLEYSHDLLETLGRLRAGFPELQEIDIPRYLPNLDAFCAELDMRFSQIERMLHRNAPERNYQTPVLNVNEDELSSLPHFETAAIAVTKSELDRLELLSRSMFDTVADIRGYEKQNIRPESKKRSARHLFIDPDRMLAALRSVVVLWISYLLWIFINPPGHAVFVVLAVTISMAAEMMSMVPKTALFFPIALWCFAMGGIYLIIMPQLSGYLQLGSMIFIVTFALFYFHSKPQQGLSLMAASSAFQFLAFIKNEQTYSFSSYANTSASMILAACLVIAASYISPSARPEKTFLRLLNRFFRNAEFFLSCIDLDSTRKIGTIQRLKATLYSKDLTTLSLKLAAWSARIDHKSFPENSPEQVQALMKTVQELVLRIEVVRNAGKQPQAPYLVKELRDDIQAWQVQIQKGLGLWSTSPETAIESGRHMSNQLTKRMDMLETRCKKTFAFKGQETLKARDYENFYRLLGSYRGLSESGIKYIQIVGKINWAHWQEARF